MNNQTRQRLVLLLWIGIVALGSLQLDVFAANTNSITLNGAAINTMESSSARFDSKYLTDIRLVYKAAGEISEVPFLTPDFILVESGDNQNDALVVLPNNYWEMDPQKFQSPALRHIENPRPDLGNPAQIVFSAIGKNGKKGIYLIPRNNFYEAAVRVETILADNNNNWHPALNGKIKMLAYVSDRNGDPQIFLMDLKTKKSRQLTNLKQALSPFMDAEGNWLYFTGIDNNQNYDIYKIKTDGTELTRLTFSPEIEKYPTLTRYGKWIVYERGTAAKRSIWVMSTDGKIQKQISDEKQWFAAPCMNEDGTKFICEGKSEGQTVIYRGAVAGEAFSGATATEFQPGLDVETEVVNLSQFGAFNQEQLAKLSQYGFFITPTKNKQLFLTYEENEYKKIPNFVTADNLLQLLHIMFDTSLRKTEAETLAPKLQKFTEVILAEFGKNKALAGPDYLPLKRYFQTMYYLIHGAYPAGVTAEDKAVIAAEIKKINQEQWADSSVLPGSKFDYSLFKIRGHYETSTDLKKYFKGMIWAGTMTFPMKTETDRRNIHCLAVALNLSPAARKVFEEIYRITSFYVGQSDDPAIYNLIDFVKNEAPNLLSAENYPDGEMQGLLKKFLAQHPSRIKTFYGDEAKNQNQVISLMGQRYVADSHYFSILFQKAGDKYLPKGLDLFAAMDNDRALNLIKNTYQDFDKYPGYNEAFTEGQKILAGIGEAVGDPLFNQWMRLLKTYANSREKEAPAVFQTAAWQDKKLNSALASWAELKHDTILYGKQTAAECGGGDEPPKVYGYIEPELGFYRSLRKTLVTMDQDLKKQGALGFYGLDRILELLDFFILVSAKELKNQPLSTQENEQLRIIGGLLEACTIEALDANMSWYEITSESAKNMAVVADVLSYWGQYLTEGVGYADEVYIIIPVQGQLYMMRGAVFSYYEFLNKARLSDAEWYQMLEKIVPEKRPSWYQPYIDTNKKTVPDPADPYDSGC
ncbi:MAG TPA: DUF3160 domain-containing protein [Bacillota bacterium]|nr:DUF3160 domain-containing protein [Bacillota bacterium]